MTIVPNHPIGFCIFLNILNICQISTVNYVFASLEDFWIRIYIVATLVLASLATTFYFIQQWAKKNMIKDKQNVLVFSVLHTLGMTFLAFDILTILDLWLEPNGLFLTEYIRAGDPMLDSIWLIGIAAIDPLFLGLVNYLIMWRIWKGKSWRSLTIIIWAWIFKSIVIFGTLCLKSWSISKIHQLSKIWFFTCPPLTLISLIPLFLPKTFTILRSTNNKPSFLNGIFKQAIKLCQLLSIILLICKALVFQFPDMPSSLFITSNDPGILLNEKNLVWNYPSIQSCTDLILVVPTFILAFYYVNKAQKPTWLYDACLTQFVFLGMGAFTAIFQSLHPETPTSFKSDLWNPNLWMITCVPLVTSGAQLIYLMVQRKEVIKSNRKMK